MKKVLIVAIALTILNLASFVDCKEDPSKEIQEKDEPVARTFFSVATVYLVQQAFIIGIIAFAVLYYIYVLIIPYKFGEIEEKRGFGSSFSSRISSLTGEVLRSVDPVDLTFGALNINEEQCRQRTVCQVRKNVALMPLMVRGAFVSYLRRITIREKYQEALEAGEALEDCFSLYPDCDQDIMEEIPSFLKPENAS